MHLLYTSLAGGPTFVPAPSCMRSPPLSRPPGPSCILPLTAPFSTCTINTCTISPFAPPPPRSAFLDGLSPFSPHPHHTPACSSCTFPFPHALAPPLPLHAFVLHMCCTCNRHSDTGGDDRCVGRGDALAFTGWRTQQIACLPCLLNPHQRVRLRPDRSAELCSSHRLMGRPATAPKRGLEGAPPSGRRRRPQRPVLLRASRALWEGLYLPEVLLA